MTTPKHVQCGSCTTPSLCINACRIEKQADEAFQRHRENLDANRFDESVEKFNAAEKAASTVPLGARCRDCVTPTLCVTGCQRFQALRQPQPPVTQVDPGKQWHSRRGWICPVCEKGVHPDAKVCPCKG